MPAAIRKDVRATRTLNFFDYDGRRLVLIEQQMGIINEEGTGLVSSIFSMFNDLCCLLCIDIFFFSLVVTLLLG